MLIKLFTSLSKRDLRYGEFQRQVLPSDLSGDLLCILCFVVPHEKSDTNVREENQETHSDVENDASERINAR